MTLSLGWGWCGLLARAGEVMTSVSLEEAVRERMTTRAELREVTNSPLILMTNADVVMYTRTSAESKPSSIARGPQPPSLSGVPRPKQRHGGEGCVAFSQPLAPSSCRPIPTKPNAPASPAPASPHRHIHGQARPSPSSPLSRPSHATGRLPPRNLLAPPR